MGCTSSCVAPTMAELNKSLTTGDERSLLRQLMACPKLLSTPTSSVFSVVNTPIHLVCEWKQVKVMQEIITFLTCSPIETVREALTPYCRRVGKSLPASVVDGVRMAVDMANAKGQTPLMYACFSDCPELVKLLLAHGADPWVGDRCGRRTALHYAAMGGSSACIQALMKHIPPRLLARHGVRYVDARSLCGLTPLHYCIYFGNLEALRELLHHFDPAINAATTSESYDVGVTCEARSSPLHFAAVTGNEQAARELLSYYLQHLGSGSGQIIRDPRTRVNALGQLPWQVAFTHHPGALSLASLLHPGQPLERVLGAASAHGSGAGGGALSQLGPAPLVAIAGAALRAKLVAELQRLKDQEETERGQRGQGCQEKREQGEQEQGRKGHGVADIAPELSVAVGTSAAVATTGPEAAPEDAAGRTEMYGDSACLGNGELEVSCMAAAGHGGGSDVEAAADEDEDDDLQCEVCFAARVAVAPAGCRHGLCGDCAEQLCQGVARRPLHCPFCRGVVTGFVRFAPQRA
ncbi:hypothetical protein PLESTF_000709600 [Pleodorina starrii]|nr:hypothetical protein PLESTF_000709600 [Pleodorina starrii]